jgi:hypothetical protein
MYTTLQKSLDDLWFEQEQDFAQNTILRGAQLSGEYICRLLTHSDAAAEIPEIASKPGSMHLSPRL